MTDNYNDRYCMPFALGSELTVESFRLSQCNNTYLLAAPRYYQFYSGYVRPRISMYRGWIQGFHNTEYGVIPSLFLQKIGAGIINTLFSRPLVLNTNDTAANGIIQSKYPKTHFPSVVKQAYGYAMEGSAGLLKLNRDGAGDLRFEAVPMDSFFIETDAYGEIEKVKSFLATYHDTVSSNREYYLCEERFFRYRTIGGIRKRFPMVHYTAYTTSSNIAYEQTPALCASITWQDIPHDVRSLINRDYGEIYLDEYTAEEVTSKGKYDRCKLLPFENDLGCRLIKFTDNIPAFPKLPFGQPLADLLMNESYAYDQLKFFERMEVYLSRGRVMIDEGQVDPNDPDARRRALDPMVFTYYDNTLSGEKDGKPQGIQLALRASEITTQKQNILNDTAFSLNLSSSTVAAWLSDGATQKTATEIEYERAKTDAFISEKLSIVQQPLQELVDLYFHYYGVTAPEVHILPESQSPKTDTIRLYSELYDKGQIPAKLLAEKILNTCSVKEVNELETFLQSKQTQSNNQSNAPLFGGAAENPAFGTDVLQSEANTNIKGGNHVTESEVFQNARRT